MAVIHVSDKPRLFGEALTGSKPGTVFTSSQAFLEDSLAVFLNGQKLEAPTCYTVGESGGPGTGFDQVTFTFTVIGSDTITADFIPE